MAGNKIGIEVQVEFPTVAELQRQLADKWKSVKNGFEGKINVGIDGHSLNRVKKQIQDALDGKEFQIKLDSKIALNEIDLVRKDLKKLDDQIAKVRNIKIKFDVGDMDKSMKDIIASNQKIEQSAEKTSQKTKEQTTNLERQLGAYDKIVRKYKMIDGKKINTHVKTTYTDEKGKQVVQSQNLKTGDVTEEQAYNRLKLQQEELNKIADIMKRIHKIEMDSMSAGKDELKILQDEKKLQDKQLETLKTIYYQKYKTNAISGTELKELRRVQEISKSLKEAGQWQQALNDEQREMGSAVQKVIALEQKKHSLQLKMITALDSEKASLRDQVSHYDRIQDKIKEKYNLENKMTDEQREQIQNLKTINSLEESRANEKKQQQALDAKTAQEQREASQRLLADLKEIHTMKMRIAQIEGRKNAGGKFGNAEEAELRLLRDQLKVSADIAQANRAQLSAKGLITAETGKQMDKLREINSAELKRVTNAQKVVAENDKIAQKIQESEASYRGVLEVEQRIARLQRDLIFAGMREREIIQDQIKAEQIKAQHMTNQLREANQLTEARKREIQAIKEASRLEGQRSLARQDAREKDMAFNDTGGLIDPYTTYANGVQAFHAILDPMKEIDEAFMQVAKVADTSDQALNNFKETAYDVGTSLGTSASEYMNAVEKWVTAGKTFQESQELGQISQVGAFVGNIAPDEMVKYMSVPMNAYEEMGLKATDVINSMNEVANNNAIEMTDLGKAYVRSATTAKNAQVTFAELNGMISAAQEATRKGGERIGTGIKTIGINIQSIQSQWKKIDKTNFDYLSGLGMELMNDDGSAKSMTDVVEELVKVQDKLKPEEFSNAVKAIAGKEHAETLQAIVDEWNTVQKVIKETNEQMNMGKDGSAYIEFAKQSDSLKFKLAELKNMWDKFMVTLGSSDGMMAGVLDGLISGLQILGNLAQNPAIMGLLKMITGMLLIRAGANGFLRIKDTLMTGSKGALKNIADIKNAWKLVGKEVDDATLAVQRFDMAERGAGNNNAPVPPVVGGMGADVNGRRTTTDRNGNMIDIDRHAPMVDINGSAMRDRNGNQIFDPRDSDPRRYRDASGNELRDRDGNPIVNPERDRPIPPPDTTKTTGALKGVGTALGKTLGLIPLVGDALILLEIMGVPVFESMGNAISKMFKTTKDELTATETAIKKFKGDNDLINGTIDAHRGKIGNLEEDAVDQGVLKIDEKTGAYSAGSNGYMEDEAFKKFKSDFNAQAEAQGMKIRIEMNDTTHILEQMKKLNAEKDKLSKEAQVKVVEQIVSDSDKLEGKEDKVAKAKLEHDQAMSRAKNAKKMLEELKDANGKVVNPEAYAMWKSELDSANKKVKSTKTDVENASKSYNKQRDAILDNARALLHEGKNFDATIMTKKQASKVTSAMIIEYGKLKKDSNDVATIQKKLADGKKLDASEFKKLIKMYPEYENVGKGKIETDKKINKEIQDKIKNTQKDKTEVLKGAEANLLASAKVADGQDKEKKHTKDAMKMIETKNESVQKSIEKNQEFSKSAEKIPKEKSFKIKITEVGKKIMDAVKDFFGIKDTVNKKIVITEEKKAKFAKASGASGAMKNVAVGTTRTTRSGRSSASVATGVPVRGAGAIVSQAKATEPKEVNNSRVSEDVWRYWKTEDKQSTLESAMRDLERAITLAKEDQNKIISALNGKLSNLNAQASNQKTLYGQKDAQMNSVLGQLKGYGFKVNTSTNAISNLEQAKNLKGEKAEKAETLLSTWHSLTSELRGISDNMKDINAQTADIKEQIKQANIAKEMKSFETLLKRITATSTSITNSDNIFGTKLGLMGAEDKELNLKTNEEALAKSQSNVKTLLAQFNELSKKQVTYKENGEQLKTTLDSLGQQILAQADNVMRYRQAINDLEFSRINSDMQEFNATLDKQNAKLKNNTENLKEGLLSGTDLSDLASSKGSVIDLSRDNAYEKDAQQRIDLEKEVQEALDGYAKKNVDRAKGVANATLELNSNMYNQLLTMTADYTNGNKTSAKTLEANYGDLDEIAKIDAGYANTTKNLEKYYNDVKKKQEDLTKAYETNMSKAKTSIEKESITDQYILDSLDIEKQYYEAQIKANNEAIKELNTQLVDASEADKVKIQEQIQAYETSNMDTQNKIKDTIKARFDFEFSLMNQAMAKTNEAKVALQNTYDLLSSLGVGNYEGKGTILDAMLETERVRNAQVKANIADLQEQQKLYEVGSYEWNIINDQLAQYNSQLTDSNKQLIDMNKSIMANSFSATTSELERKLFGGKSHDAWQQHQQLWMEGLEKEIALEKMYKRMADLGTTANKEKLDLLAKQEKLSKFEMDYLNKQLDIIELQDKVNNLEKQKTIQVLKQNANGQWDWSYEADATQVDKAKDDLAQAQLELERLQEKAREDYLQQLNKILGDAQNGQYDSVEDFRKAMEDLGDAFDTAVGDIPEIGDDYVDDLVEAYAKFVKDNAGVVTTNPTDAYLVQATETMTDSLKKTFTDISKELGEIFATALLAKLPTTTSANSSKAITSGSTAITIDKVEFPNATNKDEIQQAILGLPQLALQKAKSKV